MLESDKMLEERELAAQAPAHGGEGEAGLLSAGQERLQDFSALMKAVLQIDGVRAAVKLANASSNHRYTGVYRFDDRLLTNLYICDRRDGSVTTSEPHPLHETYCVHILQTGHAFTVMDAVKDPRLAGHPHRLDVRSYCGAPLLNQRGEVAGTVCHFDPEPDKLQGSDFEQVHITAALLQEQVLTDGGEAKDSPR